MPIEGRFTTAPAAPAPGVLSPVTFSPSVAPQTIAEPLPPPPGGAPPPPAPPPRQAAPPAPPPQEGQEEVAEEPEEQIESWRVAAIAKKEAAARRLAQEAKADREAAERAREETRTQVAGIQQRIELLRTDPNAFIREFGLDYYNRLSQHIASGGFTPEQEQARTIQGHQTQLGEAERRIAEIEKKVEERAAALEKKLEDRRTQEQEESEQRAVEEFKGEIADFVKAEGVFPLVDAAGNNAIDEVFSVVEAHYAKTGQRLGMKEACEVVNGKLLEEARRVVAIPGVREALFPDMRAPRPAPRTITNKLQAQTAPVAARGPESDQERRQRVTREIELAWGRR